MFRRGGGRVDVGRGRLRRPGWRGAMRTGDRDEGDASVPSPLSPSPAPTEHAASFP
ncbi:MAG TPA: hypothetical protein VK140_07185 [Ktedonobacteraceae bacterium]|nr:hypothetical protein [Ktedonobacteraceae bacterium]